MEPTSPPPPPAPREHSSQGLAARSWTAYRGGPVWGQVAVVVALVLAGVVLTDSDDPETVPVAAAGDASTADRQDAQTADEEETTERPDDLDMERSRLDSAIAGSRVGFLADLQMRNLVTEACDQLDTADDVDAAADALALDLDRAVTPDGPSRAEWADMVGLVEDAGTKVCPEAFEANPDFAGLLAERFPAKTAAPKPRPTTTTVPPTTVPPITTLPPVTAPPTTADPFAGQGVTQSNARRKASSYLEFSAFSRSGLISQLEYEGFSTGDATYGVDSLNVDWNDQAAKKAASYLEFASFSRSGLIDQLIYEGFTQAQAEYGVSTTGL